ncbi:hypothetical protein [Jiella avicenniae]|nr:hypothetical protein [Jiella avicenniae]
MRKHSVVADRKIKLDLTKLFGIQAIRGVPGGFRPIAILKRAA